MGEHDKYDGPDRRENARRIDNGAGHCGAHVGTQERIARLETREDSQDEKFAIIFRKLDTYAETLWCIKTSQDVIITKFTKFEKVYDQRVDLSNTVIAEYRQAMIDIGGRFKVVETSIAEEVTERKKSSWFLGPLNDAYVAAPRFIIKWVAIAVGLTVVGFSMLYRIDMERVAKFFGAIK